MAGSEPLRVMSSRGASATNLAPGGAEQSLNGKLLLALTLTFDSKLIVTNIEQSTTAEATLPAQGSTFGTESGSVNRQRQPAMCNVPSDYRFEILDRKMWKPWNHEAAWETHSGMLRIIKQGSQTSWPTARLQYPRLESAMRHRDCKTRLQGVWVSQGTTWLPEDEMLTQLRAKASKQRLAHGPINTLDLKLQLCPSFFAGPAETEWLDNGQWIVLKGESSAQVARPRKRPRLSAGASSLATSEGNAQEVDPPLVNEDANTSRERDEAAEATLTMGSLEDQPSPSFRSRDQEDSKCIP